MAINPMTTTRLVGLSSGIDTDGLVKAMSMNQQSKIDAVFRKKAVAEWRTEAYNDINNLIRVFKDDFVSALGPKSMTRADSYRTMVIEGGSPAVTIKAGTGATMAAHRIEVNQLATAASHTGSKLGEDRLTTQNLTLKAFAERFGIDLTMTDVEYNGETHQGFEFEINGETFKYGENARISDIMNDINNSKAGVKMTYSQLTNSYTLTANEIGAGSKLEVLENDSGFFAALGLGGSGAGTPSVFNPTEGKDARVQINGHEYTSSTNSFTVDGIQYTLNSTTTSAVEFNVNRDVSKSVDMMKDFVKSFNELVEKLNSYLTTRKNSKFAPLVDWQKDVMTEKEVETWEEKSREGVLHRDNGLNRVMNSLRQIVSANVAGAGSLRDIGITGGKYVPGRPFQLEIDEEKLQAALEKDPDKVYDIMTKSATKASGSNPGDAGGILARISAPLDQFTADTKSYNLQTLRDNIYKYDKDITAQTNKLYTMQEALYKKFAAFETAMSDMQAQQSKLGSYFG
jgi:flagellar hook-associated protein 2